MIRVNKDWIINVDQYSYQPMRDLHRTRKYLRKDGTETEVPDYRGDYGYYTSLKDAVKAIARIEYKNAVSKQETALSEAIRLIDETVNRFEKLLEEINE